ncbi:MAG TPA: DEDD exonuclease domain-containing protein [Acidimicrobiales bacterium]|nr:DEDD exonuclease domain-containing protein [Acidimicrobiales bacterium]
MPEPSLPPRQRSLDEAGQPLSEVTFVVVDLETTGASAATCAITEVGAVKLRGGQCLGRFQTLVNPGVAIPPQITYLTGITDSMVGPAPLIEPVLASLNEFMGDAVVVGHNVRFDVSFLDAARIRAGLPRIGNPIVDTCSLARRLVRDEVRDCRLGTLARQLRLSHQPTHRALDDALATGELLHYLLERAGTLGVLGLDDLLALPQMTGHPEAGKLRLTNRLPRTPGAYLFKDASGHVLYVGRAANLRQRVRSYFSTDERRKIGGLLRQTAAIDHIETEGTLEAVALEARLIRHLKPRFNRQAKGWERYAYVRLTLDERFPRLSVVKQARDGDGCIYIGPLGSARTARAVVEAIETAVPIRACRGRIGTGRGAAGSAVAGRPHCPTRALGLRPCPCTGGLTEAEYRPTVEAVIVGLTVDPRPLLDPLAERMRWLAEGGRFEEAAELRDRAGVLARALSRQRRIDSLRSAGRVALEIDARTTAVIVDGRLQAADGGHAAGEDRDAGVLAGTGKDRSQNQWGRLARSLGPRPEEAGRWPAPLPRQLADEAAALVSWLESNPGRVKIIDCEHGWSMRALSIPDFSPVGAPGPA